MTPGMGITGWKREEGEGAGKHVLLIKLQTRWNGLPRPQVSVRRIHKGGTKWLHRIEPKIGTEESPFWNPLVEGGRARESRGAHPGSPWLTLLARYKCLKWHGVGEREGELGEDFSSIDKLKGIEHKLGE
jgi:hypothetical protein